ncbi:gluconate 2-dehydrogenase subunit 3 family protein [Aureibaculum marinum]|uniref:Gluconate 2-dehydrogenase subunit 3 family protein n=1 Tax=Aureibaculum marinum TaxID=2487930 RepID=A0A3N4NUZ2_9FLAO|nr:gluconate 2-dehydrogenase subunit 3 family protein [Aureibaculum marinum]RPE00183.1 gluconate 2-dehydrogenase subunit 3 family protein [Aureibaculum marinum]
MNRREALKGLGLSLGYVVATPTVLSMLQSCITEEALWNPIFLSVEQGKILKTLVDLILPKTDATPGALDVNVPEFIDLYIAKTASDKKKVSFKKGLDAIMQEMGVLNKINTDVNKESCDILLAKYLRSTPEQQKAFTKKEKLVYNTLKELRDRAVWAYKTSEEIGKNVLAYDPIPGKQQGCISLEETRGKAWSL